jgi:hypothetical protein
MPIIADTKIGNCRCGNMCKFVVLWSRIVVFDSCAGTADWWGAAGSPYGLHGSQHMCVGSGKQSKHSYVKSACIEQ